MGLIKIDFSRVPKREISMDSIRELIKDAGTKRICFAFSHKNALRRAADSNVVGWLNLPFDEPFETIARHELDLNRVLFPSPAGTSYYRRIDSEAEFEKIGVFIRKYNDLVFLRDTLDLSVALSMHESEPGKRTELGEHEYQLKYQSTKNNTTADLEALIVEMQKKLEDLPYFRFADYVCVVPSNHPVMKKILKGLQGFGFTDISSMVSWKNKKGNLKNVETADEKLEMVESWGLQICDEVDLKGKTVLLIDDMYQSGVTMQYVAMKLKEAGGERVFGLTLVKSLGNQ